MIQTNLVSPSFHTFMTSISESRSLLNKIIFIQILGISGTSTSSPQESHNFNNFFWPERVDAPTSMSCLQDVVPRTPATVQYCPFCPFIFSFYPHNSEASIPAHPLPISLVHSVLTNQLKNLHRGKGAWVEWRHEGDVDVEVILA